MAGTWRGHGGDMAGHGGDMAGTWRGHGGDMGTWPNSRTRSFLPYRYRAKATRRANDRSCLASTPWSPRPGCARSPAIPLRPEAGAFGTIGRHPTWTTSVARTKAKEWRRLVDQGVDPLVEPEQAPVDTVASVIAEFIKRDQKPAIAHGAEVERILVQELAPWLERDIKSITRRDVLDRLDAITDRGAPIRAKRVLAWTKAPVRWAISGDPGGFPGAASRRQGRGGPGPGLEPRELAAVWRACGGAGNRPSTDRPACSP